MKLIITENQAKKLIETLYDTVDPTSSQISKMTSMMDGGSVKELAKKMGPEGMAKLAELLGKNGLGALLGGGSLSGLLGGTTSKGVGKMSGISSNQNATLANPLGNQPFRMGGGIGAARSHGPHQGVDLMASTGTPVYAPADGTVLKSRDIGSTCGGFVKIDHGNVITKYCHLSKWVAVEGSSVKKGDLIGYVGGGANDSYRGNSSVSHLHYEIWDKNNVVLNPQQSQFGLA